MKTQNVSDDQRADYLLRMLLSEVMSRCTKDLKKDRRQIAIELSAKVGRTITVSTLNCYTCATKNTARFPAAYVRGFCEVTGDDSLQRFLLGDRLRDLVEIGELEIAARKNRSTKETLVGRHAVKEGGE